MSVTDRKRSFLRLQDVELQGARSEKWSPSFGINPNQFPSGFPREIFLKFVKASIFHFRQLIVDFLGLVGQSVRGGTDMGFGEGPILVRDGLGYKTWRFSLFLWRNPKLLDNRSQVPTTLVIMEGFKNLFKNLFTSFGIVLYT